MQWWQTIAGCSIEAFFFFGTHHDALWYCDQLRKRWTCTQQTWRPLIIFGEISSRKMFHWIIMSLVSIFCSLCTACCCSRTAEINITEIQISFILQVIKSEGFHYSFTDTGGCTRQRQWTVTHTHTWISSNTAHFHTWCPNVLLFQWANMNKELTISEWLVGRFNSNLCRFVKML